jgi:hypothetical protein
MRFSRGKQNEEACSNAVDGRRRFGIMVCADGRGARVVEWDGLENRCGARPHRGFESHPLRSMI